MNTVQITAFPEKIEVRQTATPCYGWPVVIDLSEGSHIYLSEEMADDLAQKLWNRALAQERAA